MRGVRSETWVLVAGPPKCLTLRRRQDYVPTQIVSKESRDEDDQHALHRRSVR
jgi:hypothetical protein